MKRDVKIGKHTVRIVTTSRDYGSGMFRPGVRLFLGGPNGSPRGHGPKAWPGHMAVRRFRSTHRWAKTGWAKRNNGQYGWTNSIYLPVPHLKWHQTYRLRRLGGTRFNHWQYRLFTRLEN